MLLLVAACVSFAWPSDTPLVPGPAGALAGRAAWAWAFLGCAAAAFAAYVGGLAALDRRPARLSAVLALAAAIQVAPLGAPLLLSSDASTYWMYARIAAVHGASPYDRTPADYPDDPAFEYVGAAWRDSTSVYGPAFTLASEPVAAAAGSSHAAAAWTFKTLAALAMLACTGLAALLARRRAFAAAFVGWNPLLALHFAGGGHNDAWTAALVLAALVLAARRRPRLAGAAWAASVLVKWVSLLLLPLRALEARALHRRVDHVGFAACCVIVVAVAWPQLGAGWLAAFGPLSRNANQETAFALPHRLASAGIPRGAALALAAAAFALAYAWLLRGAAQGRARLGLAMGFALLATPYLAPWYAVWPVALAAADEDRAAQVLALAICAYLLRQTVPLHPQG